MEDRQDDIFPAEYREAQRAQATVLKTEASELGLRLETYFVPSVAAWVLTEVEEGRFLDPSEAVFVAMQVFMELEVYPDLKREFLKREIKKSLDDERPDIPGEEVMARLKEKMERRADRQPPTWIKIPYPST